MLTRHVSRIATFENSRWRTAAILKMFFFLFISAANYLISMELGVQMRCLIRRMSREQFCIILGLLYMCVVYKAVPSQSHFTHSLNSPTTYRVVLQTDRQAPYVKHMPSLAEVIKITKFIADTERNQDTVRVGKNRCP